MRWVRGPDVGLCSCFCHIVHHHSCEWLFWKKKLPMRSSQWVLIIAWRWRDVVWIQNAAAAAGSLGCVLSLMINGLQMQLSIRDDPVFTLYILKWWFGRQWNVSDILFIKNAIDQINPFFNYCPFLTFFFFWHVRILCFFSPSLTILLLQSWLTFSCPAYLDDMNDDRSRQTYSVAQASNPELHRDCPIRHADYQERQKHCLVWSWSRHKTSIWFIHSICK